MGATNRAIWALEPIAMLTARSILSFIATSTATQCSAALPTIATMITPMKNSLSPMLSAASEIEPTRISDITPTAMPATASASTERRTDHGSWPSSGSSSETGLNSSRWVLQREEQPRDVGGDQHARDERARASRLCAS